LRDDAGTRRRLLTAQLNIVTREPKGFLVLNADTLSADVELRPLNVRRLLILLRKRAVQVGLRYVFEPNGPAFARLVQRGLEDMLGHLYERGAFAGRTAAASYQVVADEALNTQRLRDRGQFIVELRVAPSWPLTFLRVRLLQHGDRLSTTEVR
jgi:phage tail sheath protein FI